MGSQRVAYNWELSLSSTILKWFPMGHILEESLPLNGTETVTYFWPVEGWWGVTPMIMLGCCCSIPKLCPTLWDPMECSPPVSSVLGISQTRILEQVAISFSRGSSWLRDWTHVSCLAGGFFTTEPPEKPQHLKEHRQYLDIVSMF